MNKFFLVILLVAAAVAGCDDYVGPSSSEVASAPEPAAPKLRARFSRWTDEITDTKSSMACIDPDTSAPENGYSLGRVCLRKDGKKSAVFFDIGALEMMRRHHYQSGNTYGWYDAGLAEVRIKTPDGRVFIDTFETVISEDGTKSFVRSEKTAAKISDLFERGATIKVRFTLADTQQITLSYSNYVEDLKEVKK